MSIEPKITVRFQVTAYDCGGYGDDRSRDFKNGEEAVTYAQSLEPRFGAVVDKVITMETIHQRIWQVETP